jgi:hypothetical protein
MKERFSYLLNLREAASIFWNNPKLAVPFLLMLMVNLPWLFLNSYFFKVGSMENGFSIISLLLLPIFYLVSIAASLVAFSWFIALMNQIFVEKKQLDLGAGLKEIKRYILKLLGVGFLAMVGIMIISIPLMIIYGILLVLASLVPAAGLISVILAFLLMVCLFILSFLILAALMHIFPIILYENKDVMETLRHCIRYSWNNRLHTIKMMFVFVPFYFIFSAPFLIYLTYESIKDPFFISSNSYIILTLIMSIIGIIFQIIMMLFYIIAYKNWKQ